MVRIIITSILGILLLFGAYQLASKMIETRNIPKPIEKKMITPVSIRIVENVSSPITLKTSGNLVAKNQIEIFSEVMGIFEASDHDFKPGSRFQKGEVLLQLNSDEHRANLRAQKSNLINQITLFLPDLKLDYPDAFPQWEKYVQDYEISKPLDSLPGATSEKEKLFILGRGINTTYYNIENLEERLNKYVITAPFNGVLSEVQVYPGALVRNGQKLANFLSTSIYEMEVNVNVSYMDLLRTGKTVTLHNLERTKTWMGRVTRLNGLVDQSTQTIKVYIDVSGSGLREGLYLEADIKVKNIENTFEVDRKLLFDQDKLFIVRDSVLQTLQIKPVFYNESTVVVEGLENGMEIISRIVPGAHNGMRVEIIQY